MLLVCAVYMETIEKTKAVYQEEAQAMLSQDNREKAQILLTKRKLVEREASVNYFFFSPSAVQLGMPMQRQRGVRGRRFGWFSLHSTCMFLYLYAYHVNKTFDFVILNVCSFVWYEY